LKEKCQEGLQVRYAEFSVVERFVPLIFASLYAAVLVKALF
jgi:hypothetical protein